MMSKRDLLKGSAVVGIAVAAPTMGVAQSPAPTPVGDPKTKFTTEPFAEQKQEWPGSSAT